MDTSKKLFDAFLVDDEIWALRGLQGIINWEEYGFNIVETFTDSVKALERLKEVKPRVLFTDIRMPDIDGMSLIEKINEAGLNLSVVIVSAYRDFEIAKKAIKNDVADYLIKPLDKEEVKATVSRLYEKLLAEDTQDFSILDYDLSDPESYKNVNVTKFLSSFEGKRKLMVYITDSDDYPKDATPIYIKGYSNSYIIENPSTINPNSKHGLSPASDIGNLQKLISLSKKSFDGNFDYSDNEQLWHIQEYLFDHLSEKISMEELADAFYLSKPYIFELFRKNSDTSAMNFLKTVRMSEASKLLRTTDLSVSEVADKVGYDDPGYFIKTFKATFGVTPEKYKE